MQQDRAFPFQLSWGFDLGDKAAKRRQRGIHAPSRLKRKQRCERPKPKRKRTWEFGNGDPRTGGRSTASPKVILCLLETVTCTAEERKSPIYSLSKAPRGLCSFCALHSLSKPARGSGVSCPQERRTSSEMHQQLLQP